MVVQRVREFFQAVSDLVPGAEGRALGSLGRLVRRTTRELERETSEQKARARAVAPPQSLSETDWP